MTGGKCCGEKTIDGNLMVTWVAGILWGAVFERKVCLISKTINCLLFLNSVVHFLNIHLN